MKMYHGVKLNEVTEPQVFDPPKEMYVWDDNGDVTKKTVFAIGSQSLRYPVLTSGGNFHHCANTPEPKPVTNRELAHWIAEGKGEVMDNDGVFQNWFYWTNHEDDPIKATLRVRKWSETEWHKPTREYLGLGD